VYTVVSKKSALIALLESPTRAPVPAMAAGAHCGVSSARRSSAEDGPTALPRITELRVAQAAAVRIGELCRAWDDTEGRHGGRDTIGVGDGKRPWGCISGVRRMLRLEPEAARMVAARGEALNGALGMGRDCRMWYARR
jgi:hypothetical protein